MKSRLDMARFLLDSAYRSLQDNLRNLTLEEALFVPAGGYRSILGTLKHIAGWSHVYRSFAFDQAPQHWDDLDWPHGLRDTILKSEAYLRDVIQWIAESQAQWQTCLGQLEAGQIEELRPAHWGEKLPLFEILVLIAMHHEYHAGEINQLLSIYRGEAWEEGEEVEENHVSTVGHRVIPPWKREP
jgi:uncharacterized damage-inducible protein DinB